MKTHLLGLFVLCAVSDVAVAAEPITLKLWPDGPPTAMVPKSEATAKLIQSYGGAGPNRITDVSDPTITVFRPEKPNGTAVIVAPGGGFMFLSYAHEGTQVCEWLNLLWVTAVLLKYRTPLATSGTCSSCRSKISNVPWDWFDTMQRNGGSIRSELGSWGSRREPTWPGMRRGIAAVEPMSKSRNWMIRAARIFLCSSTLRFSRQSGSVKVPSGIQPPD